MKNKNICEYFVMRERLAPAKEIPEKLFEPTVKAGQLYSLKLPDGNSAICFRRDNQFHAYLAICPHMGGDLSKASYDSRKNTLTCCWHGYSFDAISGAFQKNPNIADMELLRDPTPNFDPTRRPNYHLQKLKVDCNDEWLSVRYPDEK